MTTSPDTSMKVEGKSTAKVEEICLSSYQQEKKIDQDYQR